jgi:hypothetical protein
MRIGICVSWQVKLIMGYFGVFGDVLCVWLLFFCFVVVVGWLFG